MSSLSGCACAAYAQGIQAAAACGHLGEFGSVGLQLLIERTRRKIPKFPCKPSRTQQLVPPRRYSSLGLVTGKLFNITL